MHLMPFFSKNELSSHPLNLNNSHHPSHWSSTPFHAWTSGIPAHYPRSPGCHKSDFDYFLGISSIITHLMHYPSHPLLLISTIHLVAQIPMLHTFSKVWEQVDFVIFDNSQKWANYDIIWPLFEKVKVALNEKSNVTFDHSQSLDFGP